MMNRREFITLLGGAAAAWPVVARAQRPEKMRRIGVLMNFAADDVEGQQRLAAFLQGLQEAGWEVGRNVRVDIRWAGDVEFPLRCGYAMQHAYHRHRALLRARGERPRRCAAEQRHKLAPLQLTGSHLVA